MSRETAEAVVEAAATVTGLPKEAFFLADHKHEGMRKGCWSIAFEGWTGDRDWPSMVSEAQFDEVGIVPPGVFLEPKTSWCLGVYPVLVHS